MERTRIVRTDCTWIDGESVAAGVECATGATAAIDLSRHRNSDWHPLGSVEKDSECVDCMIYSEWNAHSSVAAAVAFAVVAVVVVVFGGEGAKRLRLSRIWFHSTSTLLGGL